MPEEAMFRSAEMAMIQLYIPAEIARETVYSLGSLGLVEFRDLNKKVNEFQRSFVNEIRRLDNVERQYRLLKTTMDKRGVDMSETLIEDLKFSPSSVLSTSQLDETCSNAQLLEDRITELSEASEGLLQKQTDLKQYQQVLNATGAYFDRSYGAGDLIDLTEPTVDGGESGTVQHSTGNFVTGVIPRAKVQILEKILWRVLRGNLFMQTTEISEKMLDPQTKTPVDKNCFVVFSHGELILQRIRKICESLDADLYFVDPEHAKRQVQKKDINDKLADVTTVLETTDRALETELRVVAPELDTWWKAVKLEKSVYEIMNRCYYDLNRRCLIGEGWVPQDDLSRIQSTLDQISTGRSSSVSEESGADDSVPIIMNRVETTRTPPTYFKTNKFTQAFQAMCDSYGTASYREVNAGLPTIATFPFIFAIMFGDMGHGFLMFLAALMLVIYEKPLRHADMGEIFDMAYYGRYLVLMMGAFSIYTGFLYNDIFSLSTTFFKSGWEWPSSWKEGDLISGKSVGVYPIGMDPIWHGAENALLFANSYKMKLSILMGFIHMSYSYSFSLVNAVYFRKPIDIIGNFIPGFVFMHGIFGYLCVCIVYKWTVDWIAISKPAPSLLNMLINMFLSPGTVDEQLYSGQANVQVVLLLLALICVPCLLLIKPLWFKHTHSKGYQGLPVAADSRLSTNNLLSNLNIEDDDDKEEEQFGDVMINQVIHTIEFCLNTVSHTASYLRLWALSLAHSQLSAVLWSMTLGASFGFTGAFGSVFIVIMFCLWFVLTVCILVVMEGTSAMLHALRLHWVESMSKFFEGEGIPYTPYSFVTVLDPTAA